jgi:hypothetical protein
MVAPATGVPVVIFNTYPLIVPDTEVFGSKRKRRMLTIFMNRKNIKDFISPLMNENWKDPPK